MKTLVAYPFALFASATALGVIWFAWPRIEAFVVTMLAWAFGIVIAALTACVVAMAVGFTFWRLNVARADARIADSAATFAAEAASPIQPVSTNVENLWDKGYCDLGWLGFTVGTLALSRMRPYFQENAERLWRHMTGELKRTGRARGDTAFTSGR